METYTRNYDTTPEIYCFINRHGQRISLLPNWETANIAQKETAAIVAGKRSREERLRQAINSMKNAGEIESAIKIINTCLY